MTKKTFIFWTIAIAFCILIGIGFSGFIYNQFHIFGNFAYEAFFLVLISTILLGLVLYLIAKSKLILWVTVFVILLLCISTLTSTITLKVAGRNAIKLADKIIKELYVYRHVHGQFPEIIDSLNTDRYDIDKFKKTQAYILDKQQSAFSIYAWNDGWYYHVYNSSDSSWQQKE